jgi:hypothetical protein
MMIERCWLSTAGKTVSSSSSSSLQEQPAVAVHHQEFTQPA